MYKIETHLHTKYSSHCGRLDEQQILHGYAQAGYAGIVVTDHYNRTTFEMKNIDLTGTADKVTPFLEGYYRLKEAARAFGIRIYKGAELRFDGSANDYLLYNFTHDLLSDPAQIFEGGLSRFIERSRKSGALLLQAHPFRDPCTPAQAQDLDGLEILNLHPRHNSNNILAQQMADEYRLIGISGSDCHQMPDIARGGILVDFLPEDEAQLVALLKSRNFRLIDHT